MSSSPSHQSPTGDAVDLLTGQHAEVRRLFSQLQGAPTHPHRHGPESAVGNLLVGSFVAVVDRVRNALRGGRAQR